MITPHVRPDTDTYRFTVTQITLASETFPAGADHCVTEPYRDAAPGRRTRAPVGPRPAGRPGPCHRGSTLRVADAVAAHLSVRQTKSAPTTQVNDVLVCRTDRCADSRGPDQEAGDRTCPTPRPGRRIPGHRRGCADFSAGRCHGSPDLSAHPPDRHPQGPSGAAPVGIPRCSALRIVGQADGRPLRSAALHPQTPEAAEEPADATGATGSSGLDGATALRGTAERGVGGASGGCRDGGVGNPVLTHTPTQPQDPARRHRDRRQSPSPRRSCGAGRGRSPGRRSVPVSAGQER